MFMKASKLNLGNKHKQEVLVQNDAMLEMHTTCFNDHRRKESRKVSQEFTGAGSRQLLRVIRQHNSMQEHIEGTLSLTGRCMIRRGMDERVGRRAPSRGGPSVSCLRKQVNTSLDNKATTKNSKQISYISYVFSGHVT